MYSVPTIVLCAMEHTPPTPLMELMRQECIGAVHRCMVLALVDNWPPKNMEPPLVKKILSSGNFSGATQTVFSKSLMRLQHLGNTTTSYTRDVVVPYVDPGTIDDGLLSLFRTMEFPDAVAHGMCDRIARESSELSEQLFRMAVPNPHRDVRYPLEVTPESDKIRLKYEPSPESRARFLVPFRTRNPFPDTCRVPGTTHGPMRYPLYEQGVGACGKYICTLYVTKARFRDLAERYTDPGVPDTDRTVPDTRETWRSMSRGRRRFILAVFVVLARYETIAGNVEGMQGGVPPGVMDVLDSRLDITTECFASPLNVTLSNFCSAYPDVDEVFGSWGSFFDFEPSDGGYEVNPPFTGRIMDATVRHIHKLLDRSSSAGGNLVFFVIVPTYDDNGTFFKALEASRYLLCKCRLQGTNVHYIHGFHHREPNTKTWTIELASTWFLLGTPGVRVDTVQVTKAINRRFVAHALQGDKK